MDQSDIIGDIFLVDDDVFSMKLMSRTLRNAGARNVTCLSDANEAVAMIGRGQTEKHLVILGRKVEALNSGELLRQLVDAGFGGSVVYTGDEQASPVEAGCVRNRVGGTTVLGRLATPVDENALLEMIGKWRLQAVSRMRQDERQYSAEAIREAIRSKELVTHFQPKVDVATRSVMAMEALVRWQHPTDGLLLPDRFIAQAEEGGVIDELTDEVVRQALKEVRNWRDLGLQWKVSINVSVDNLSRLDFPDRMMDLVASARVDASNLTLEVTESRLPQDKVPPADIMARLRLRQFGLSIDNFGSGFSSLQKLCDIPFGEIKIDKSFVSGAHARDTLRTIFDASHQMAKRLRIRTVAEGVESGSDWEFVESRGCDQAQGYYIGKPMPADQLGDWCAQWESRREVLDVVA